MEGDFDRALLCWCWTDGGVRDGVAAALKEELEKEANEEKDKRKHHSSTNTLAWRVGRESLVQNLQRSAWMRCEDEMEGGIEVGATRSVRGGGWWVVALLL